jgi:hypothetical protein
MLSLSRNIYLKRILVVVFFIFLALVLLEFFAPSANAQSSKKNTKALAYDAPFKLERSDQTTTTTTTTTTTVPPTTTKPVITAPKAPAPVAAPSGTHADWMAQAGIPESDWGYATDIFNKESGFNHLAVNRSSGATGICQSLPGSKMASAGADYLTNPVTQLRWCHSYAISRYSSWANAHSFWLRNHWW